MLYLVLPNRGLQWTDNIGQEVLDFADAEGKDLAAVDWWKDADHPAEEDVVRVALRYGITCSTGIVVDGGHVYLVRRPTELKALFLKGDSVRAKAAPQRDAVNDFIEKNWSPGWTQASRELDARVEASHARTVAEASEDAKAEVTARAPRDELIAHWTRLGGILPDPV